MFELESYKSAEGRSKVGMAGRSALRPTERTLYSARTWKFTVKSITLQGSAFPPKEDSPSERELRLRSNTIGEWEHVVL